MKERPLLQRERLQLPAWDNCKNVQSRPKLEECGCPGCPPQHTKPSKSWLTSARNQICFVFVWPKQKFQEHLSDVATFDASAAGVSWGGSAFAFQTEQDWRISMAVLKNTKAYTSNLKQNYFRSSWKKSLCPFSCGCFNKTVVVAASAGGAGASVACKTQLWEALKPSRNLKPKAFLASLKCHNPREMMSEALSAKSTSGVLWDLTDEKQ